MFALLVATMLDDVNGINTLAEPCSANGTATLGADAGAASGADAIPAPGADGAATPDADGSAAPCADAPAAPRTDVRAVDQLPDFSTDLPPQPRRHGRRWLAGRLVPPVQRERPPQHHNDFDGGERHARLRLLGRRLGLPRRRLLRDRRRRRRRRLGDRVRVRRRGRRPLPRLCRAVRRPHVRQRRRRLRPPDREPVAAPDVPPDDAPVAAPDSAPHRDAVSAAHLAELAPFYQSKRDRLVDGLKSSRSHVSPAEGGYFQLLGYGAFDDRDDRTTTADWCTRMNGLALIPLSPFFPDGKHDSKLVRICFAKNDDTIDQGIERLINISNG